MNSLLISVGGGPERARLDMPSGGTGRRGRTTAGCIKSVFAEGVERMIASIANLLPKAPSARDEAVDMACRCSAR